MIATLSAYIEAGATSLANALLFILPFLPASLAEQPEQIMVVVGFAGQGLFANVNSGSLEFKSITVGTGLSIANTATEVSITVDNANLNAGTLGGLASTAFLQKSDNLAAVADVSSARTNLGVYSKSESDSTSESNSGISSSESREESTSGLFC